MAHGGKRDGAGRKTGSYNLITKELKAKIDAESLVMFLQDLALGKIKDAKISERKEAAIALLRKVMPDIRENINENDNHNINETYEGFRKRLDEERDKARAEKRKEEEEV